METLLEEISLEEQIDKDRIENYKERLILEMKKQGASSKDLKLIKDATIRNAIKYERNPEDVAWALLQ